MLLGFVGKLVGQRYLLLLVLLLSTKLLLLLRVVGVLILGVLNFLGVSSIPGVIVLGLSDFSISLGRPRARLQCRPCGCPCA